MAETTSTSSSLPASALASGVDFEPEKLLTDLIVVAHGPEDFQGFLQQVVEQVRQQLHLPAAGILSWEGQTAQSVVSPATGIPVLRVQSGNLSESSSDSDRLVLVPLEIRQKAWGVLQLAEERDGQLNDIASRLSSLGRAIGGIIALRQERDTARASRQALELLTQTSLHDLNNVLTAILGSSELLAHRPWDLAAMAELLLAEKNMVDRLATLRRILRLAQPELRMQHLAPLLQQTVSRLRPHPFLRALEIRLELDDIGCVPVDAGVFTSAIENLLLNAARALQGRQGQITVRLSFEEQGNDGPCAHVVVEDNGPGIPESVKSKLFMARVTTNPQQPEEHGLGLMSVRMAVEGFHGGHVSVETSTVQPTFTRFHLLLPQHPSTLRH